MTRVMKEALTGRTLSDNPKAHRLTLRYTAAELVAVKEAAAASGLTATDWVRSRSIPRSCRPAIREIEPGNRSKRPTSAIDTRLFIELRRQGVNLNQIAHRLNSQDLAHPADLSAVIAEIRAILARLAKPSRTE
jgi:hypothetical protein